MQWRVADRSAETIRRPAPAHAGERAAARGGAVNGRAAARRAAQREREEARRDARNRRREAADDARDAPGRVVQAGAPSGSSRCIAAWARCRALAVGVGDLKRVLTNVKTRGTWGEVQLGRAARRRADAAQYAKNVATRPGSERARRVRDPPSGPRRRRRAVLAADRRQVPARGLAAAAGGAGAGRHRRGRGEPPGARRSSSGSRRSRSATSTSSRRTRPTSRSCSCPTEGLYAEAVARPGLADTLQREFRVTLAGPTNLVGDAEQPAAGLSHARDREALDRGVAVLGAVKTEFGKFGEHPREDQGEARPGRQDARRGAGARARRSRASCATSRRCREAEAERLLDRGEGDRGEARHRRVAVADADRCRGRRRPDGGGAARCSTPSASGGSERVLRTRRAARRAVARGGRGAAVPRDLHGRRARAAARPRRPVPRRQEHRRRAAATT